MTLPTMFKRLPRHIAIIPDGNRRWAQRHGLPKEAGYVRGLQPGIDLCNLCLELGIEEVSVYGFTNDNTHRPAEQRIAFQQACVAAVESVMDRDVDLLVCGNAASPLFPPSLLPYTTRTVFGRGLLKANFLINYDWHWDLAHALRDDRPAGNSRKSLMESIGSAAISRVDLVIRWGGRCRLSGMLPVQCVYADMYVVDDMWPDFHPDQFYEALRWYETQDVTLGG